MNKTLKKDLESVDEKSVEVMACVNSLGITTKAATQFIRVALANALLMERKQLDYGPDNIGDFGSFGVVVRINDKMKRLKHLYTKQGRKRVAINESIEDNFRDLSNYGIIALLVDLDLWPKE